MLIASRRLGEFLVDLRVLSRDVLEEMLAREQREGVHLSRLLVASGVVSEKDIIAAVADQIGVPFVDLADHPIRPDVHGLVPEDMARHYLAVAVDRTAAGVVVAMEDPSDRSVVAAIEEDTGERVVAAIAVRDELERVIEETYGAGADDWVEPDVVAPVVLSLDAVLEQALDVGASDVHLTVGLPPCVRRHGSLERSGRIPGAERLRAPAHGVRRAVRPPAGAVRARARAGDVARAAGPGEVPHERVPAAGLGGGRAAGGAGDAAAVREARRAGGRAQLAAARARVW